MPPRRAGGQPLHPIYAPWQAVDVAAVNALPKPVGLDQIKANSELRAMPLVRLPRLSVQPVTDGEWCIICKMGGLG